MHREGIGKGYDGQEQAGVPLVSPSSGSDRLSARTRTRHGSRAAVSARFYFELFPGVFIGLLAEATA